MTRKREVGDNSMLHAASVLLLVVFIGALAAGVIPHRAGSLRWARFFFRGWVVISLLWVAVIAGVSWGSIVAPVPAPAAECGHPGEMACVTKDDALVGHLAPRELQPAPLSVVLRRAEHVAVLALLPPLVLFGIGLACAWVLRRLRGGAAA
jgi:hypothetical protein